MFTDIKDAIAYIESKRNKRTVDELRETLNSVNIPMKQKNMIHIAGTNGKGSTVNYLRAILNAHGYRVGTFTSPYLVCHNDRICVDGEMISDDDLLRLINKYEDVIERDQMSMFEIDVMIMLDYFASQDLDFRIIECGIGGAHDKTNVIDPIVTAITNIGRDHLEQIGPTLFDVINEKMGIIKPGHLFVTTETSGTILARFQEQCDAVNAKMVVVPELALHYQPMTFFYRDMTFCLKDQALYQADNAHLALTIANKIITLDREKTVAAVEGASWGGRFERFSYHGKTIIIDGAHNVPGIKALTATINYRHYDDFAVIFATLREKETDLMLDELRTLHCPLYVTTFSDERAALPVDLADVIVIKDFQEAIALCAMKYQTIFITGSLHFISAVRAFLLVNGDSQDG